MTNRTFYCADCGQQFQTTRDSQSRCNPCRVEAGDKPLYDDEVRLRAGMRPNESIDAYVERVCAGIEPISQD